MLLLTVALAAAQPAAPPAPPVAVPAPAAAAPIDPARLAIAERVVVALVPPGTYVRMMRDQLPKLMDGMMAGMGSMTAGELGLPAGSTAPGETLDEAARKADPAYRERMSITMRVMFEEMGTLFGTLEPRLRAGLSRAFARRYTAAQLADLDTFFATPSGKAFAGDYLLTFVDPEVMSEMMSMAPELMKAMPEIIAKAEAATAHLPPPPKPAKTK